MALGDQQWGVQAVYSVLTCLSLLGCWGCVCSPSGSSDKACCASEGGRRASAAIVLLLRPLCAQARSCCQGLGQGRKGSWACLPAINSIICSPYIVKGTQHYLL